MTRAEIQRDVASVLRHFGVTKPPTNASVSEPPPPVFHCHWCGAPLKRPAKACQGHTDVEEIYADECYRMGW